MFPLWNFTNIALNILVHIFRCTHLYTSLSEFFFLSYRLNRCWFSTVTVKRVSKVLIKFKLLVPLLLIYLINIFQHTLLWVLFCLNFSHSSVFFYNKFWSVGGEMISKKKKESLHSRMEIEVCLQGRFFLLLGVCNMRGC